MAPQADSPSLGAGTLPAEVDPEAVTEPIPTPAVPVAQRHDPDLSTATPPDATEPVEAAPESGSGTEPAPRRSGNAAPDRPFWVQRAASDTTVRLGSRDEVFLPRRGLASLFRLPGAGDPAPDGRRMVGLCTWATALGLVGMAVALRGLYAILSGTDPFWYEPALIIGGLAGITLTVGGFLSIQRRRLPWLMLGGATVPLLLNLVLTIVAL
ncbi:hypothetical protein [Polymorphospora sp. NPDC050346]|uniref:hypothetical protein n=1 Tax=Polymorphospora sp. NPDC050346 TaxID=3155780 RepID=UPI0033E4467E